MSLTSVICKLLERLIKDHMVDFLVKHQLLNSSQHGFLKARSCLTNMFCFLEEITKWIDVGSPVDIIYLDFHKWRRFKLEIGFEWGTLRISIRTYIILNIYQ